MSSSDRPGAAIEDAGAADFDAWLQRTFAETGGFTALILLLQIGDTSVKPVSSSYVHVIGDDLPWSDLRRLLDASGRAWDGVVLFAESAEDGGPILDLVAKTFLQERARAVIEDRMRLNEAGFFDKRGRALKVEPIEVN